MVNKVNKNLIITIFLIALLVCSTVIMSFVVGNHTEGELHAPLRSDLANSIDDTNGTVDSKVDGSTGGDVPSDAVAIASEAQLKAFFNGSAMYGYLTGNIASFNWGLTDNRIGTKYEFGVDRVLDGNGYSIGISVPKTVPGTVEHINYRSLNNWAHITYDQDYNDISSRIDVSAIFIAINQGKLKNINFTTDFTDGNYTFSHYPPNDGSKPLAFGLVTGVNFGYIDNCTLLERGNIRIDSVPEGSATRDAKAHLNSLDFGGFAGVNAGQIIFCTVDIRGKMHAQANVKYAANRNSSSRVTLGGFVGRMLSDRNYEFNYVKLTAATVHNSIVKGNGELRVEGFRSSNGASYRHVGAIVGGNSFYSGTTSALHSGVTGQNIGQIDGIISAFNGKIENSASGEPSGNRAMVDCGRISNVTFLDGYNGHIDNCACSPTGNGEHGASRANALKVTNEGDVKIGFDKTVRNNAAIIITTTAKEGENDLIFAVNKRTQTLNAWGGIDYDNKVVPLFNYNTSTYYSTAPSENNSKKAIVSIIEPRSIADESGFVIEVAFGKKGITSFQQPDASDLKYDGKNKINVSVKYASDGAGMDTLTEQGKYITFKADRTYLGETKQSYGLSLPGRYSNIMIVSSLSDIQSYVDPELYVVARAVMPGASYTINIDPADIIITDPSGAEVINTDIKGPNGLPLSEYTFRFKVYQDNSATNKIELQGLQFNKIQFTNQGTYNWQDVTYSIDDNFIVTATLYVNTTTAETGRNYRFRALMNSEPVTRPSTQYKLFIDNDAPGIEVKAEAGSKFNVWSDKQYNMIIKATDENIDRITVNGNSAGVVTVNAGREYTYMLTNSIVYTVKAYDKSGNFTEYTVTPKIDTTTPVLIADVFSYTSGGDRIPIPNGTASKRNIEIDLSMNNMLMPYVIQYSISSDNDRTDLSWKLVGGTQVIADRTFNPLFNSNDPTLNSNVWDYYHFRIVMDNGTVYYYGNDIKHRVDKKVIEIDFDKIQVDNGIFIINGLDETLKRKDYDGRTTTTTAFIEAISNAVNSMTLDGDRTNDANKLKVTAEYASKEIGRWDIKLEIIDPLNLYTISNIYDLKGNINPAAVDIRVENAQREYGAPDPKFNVIFVKGIVVGDELPIIEGITSVANVYSEIGLYSINVPKVGTELVSSDGVVRYKIKSINSDAKLKIVPQVLNRIDYDDSFLNFNYNGDGHEVKAHYLAPDNSKVKLDVTYYRSNIVDGVPVYSPLALGALPTDIGQYRAVLSITDNINYVLSLDRSIIDFEVHKGNVSINIDEKTLDRVYNGKEHVVIAELSNGSVPKITYHLEGSSRALIESMPVNAGTYIVKIEYDNELDVNNVGNYYSITQEYSLIIDKAKFDSDTIKFHGDAVKVYDGKSSTLAVSGIPENTTIKNVGGSLIDKGNGVYQLFEETNAGKYSMKLSLSNENYIATTFNPSLEIQLAKFASAGLVLDGETTLTYDGNPHTLKLLGIPSDTTILGMRDNHADVDTATLTATAAGKHNFFLTLRNPNFVEEKIQAELKISAAKYNGIIIRGIDKIYDGRASSVVISNIPEPNITKVMYIRDGQTALQLANDGAGNYALPERINSGDFTERVYLDNPNYTRETFTAKATIRQASYQSVNITYDDVRATYTGGAHRIVLNGAPAGTKFLSTETGLEISNVFAATEVGVYRVGIRLSNPNYNDLYSVRYATLFIEKTENTIEYKFDSSVVDYNGNGHTLTFDVSQLGEGFTHEMIGISYTNAGTYNYRVIIRSNNYLDRELSATLEINKIKSIDADKFIAENVVVDYNDARPIEITLKTDGVANLSEYTVTYRYTGEGLLLPGSKPVFPSGTPYNATITITHPNYISIVLERTVTINLKKIVGIEIAGGEFTYDETQHPVQIIKSDSATEGLFERVTYNGSPSAPSNAGTYKVMVELSMLHYETLVLETTIVINKTNLKNSVTLNGINKMYDGKSSKLEFTGLPNGSVLDFSMANNFVNAGNHEVTVTVTNNNYNTKDYKATVVITPRMVEVTYVGEESYKANGIPNIKAKFIDITGKEVEVDVAFADGFNGKKAGKYVAKPIFPEGNYSASANTAEYAFTLTSNVSVGAIAGGTAGGAVGIGAIILLVVILKKKLVKI